jgi:hypothetical protein
MKRRSGFAFGLVVFLIGVVPVSLFAAAFAPGEVVRLSRNETLSFKGKDFTGAPKGHEFTVLKHDAIQRRVYVGYYKGEELIAVSIPQEAVEALPPDAWIDLRRGAEAFRDQRFDEARRHLQQAMRDPACRTTASKIDSAMAAARPALAGSLQGLREIAGQLHRQGMSSIALPIDEGIDRVGARLLTAAEIPPSKIDRVDVANRVTTAARSVARARQSIALRRMIEASGHLKTGQEAEPNRTEWEALQAAIQKGIRDAEESYEAANRMRRFEKGAIHALTALERGLKYCADSPKLRELRTEMQALFEQRTAPAVTEVFLAAARTKTPWQALEEGRKIYTTRCVECHDLELLDSRSVSAWRDVVARMSRRAELSGDEEARVIDYLTAAQNGLE